MTVCGAGVDGDGILFQNNDDRQLCSAPFTDSNFLDALTDEGLRPREAR